MKQRVMALVLAGILAAAARLRQHRKYIRQNNDAKPTVAYKDMKVGETETDLKSRSEDSDEPHRSGGFRLPGLHQQVQRHISEHQDHL